MAFNPNIPQATDIPAVSQGQLLTNFTQLNTIFGNNHVTFDAASDNGKHNFCQFPEQGAAPATAANEGALYTAVGGSGATELFFRRESNGALVQLTGTTVNAGFASSYCTFTGAGVLSANSLNVASVVRNAVGNYSVNFTTNFANTNYVALVNPNISGVFQTLVVTDKIKLVNRFSFQVKASNGANADPANADVVIYGVLV